MSSEKNDLGDGNKRSLAKSLTQAPWLTLLVAVATIIGGIAGAISCGYNLLTTENPRSSSPSISPVNGADDTGPPSSRQSNPSSTTLTAGCYRDDTQVDCKMPHTREVFTPIEGQVCDQDSLVLFLGGEIDLDVLNQALIIDDTDDGSTCIVEPSSKEQPLKGSLKDVWLTDADEDGYRDGGRYRPCLNHQGLDVSCEEAHHTEVFYQGMKTVDCRARYEEFVQHDFTPDSNKVKVVSGTRGDFAACWVEILTQEDTLIASVRALGSMTLPISR